MDKPIEEALIEQFSIYGWDGESYSLELPKHLLIGFIRTREAAAREEGEKEGYAKAANHYLLEGEKQRTAFTVQLILDDLEDANRNSLDYMGKVRAMEHVIREYRSRYSEGEEGG